jgi:hypothetical protein
MKQRLTLELPEPPALNAMLDIAKRRTRRTKRGGWRQDALPTVYDEAKHEYGMLCTAETRGAGVFPPREPWLKWRLVEVRFRLHTPRDPIELLAGLKWPVDWLVDQQFVLDDSARHLVGIPLPEQVVDRANRGVTITIERADDHGE